MVRLHPNAARSDRACGSLPNEDPNSAETWTSRGPNRPSPHRSTGSGTFTDLAGTAALGRPKRQRSGVHLRLRRGKGHLVAHPYHPSCVRPELPAVAGDGRISAAKHPDPRRTRGGCRAHETTRSRIGTHLLRRVGAAGAETDLNLARGARNQERLGGDTAPVASLQRPRVGILVHAPYVLHAGRRRRGTPGDGAGRWEARRVRDADQGGVRDLHGCDAGPGAEPVHRLAPGFSRRLRQRAQRLDRGIQLDHWESRTGSDAVSRSHADEDARALSNNAAAAEQLVGAKGLRAPRDRRNPFHRDWAVARVGVRWRSPSARAARGSGRVAAVI